MWSIQNFAMTGMKRARKARSSVMEGGGRYAGQQPDTIRHRLMPVVSTM